MPCPRWSCRVALSLAALSASHAVEIGIAGRALGPAGQPLPEAAVLLLRAADPVTRAHLEAEGRLPEPAARGKTEVDGSFEIVAPDAGLYAVRIQAPGFVPVEYSLTPLLEPVELPDAEVPRDAGLTVRVSGKDGRPLSGATVRISPPRPRFGPETASWKPAIRVGKSDNGAVRLMRGESEAVVLTVTAPGHLLEERGNVRGTSTTFELAQGRERTIEVRSADGKGVGGALVAVGETNHPLGFTDEHGALKIALPPRGLHVTVVADDGRSTDGMVFPPDKAEASPRRFSLPGLQSMTGRVIDAQTRRALPGAWVFRKSEAWAAAPTDASGNYTLKVAGGSAIEVVAGATGYLPPEAIETRIESAESPGPTVALRPAAAIEGLVVDGAGKPVAGAKVRLQPKRSRGEIVIFRGRGPSTPDASTSSRGRFRLSAVDPSKSYDLETRAAGFAPGSKEIVGLEPRKTMKGVRIELDAGQRVTGRAVDASGQPVREAEAALRPTPRDRGMGGMIALGEGPRPEAFKAATDENGRFSIGGLETGTFDLVLWRKGFAKRPVQGIEVKKGPEPVDLGDLVLEPGERIVGRVADSEGKPIEGVQISIVEGGEGHLMVFGGPPPSQQPDSVTDLEGWFTLLDLRRNDLVQLSFSRKGYLDARESGVRVPSPEPLLVTLRPSSKVSGTVVDPGRKPIPAAQVSMTRSQSGGIGGNAFRMVRRDGATADDMGRFVFEGVEPGTISLTASASGKQEAKIDALEVPKGQDLEGVEIVLKPGAILTGRVLAPDGRPAIGAHVGLVHESDLPVRFEGSGTDGDGRYRVEGVEPGKVSVEATHEDYVRTVKDTDARPGVNVLDLQLEGGNEVAGVVVDPTGSPVPAAGVRLAPRGSDWGGPDTSSGPDGSFRLAGVGDGDYAIWAGKKGFAPSSGAVTVKVEGQAVRDLRVELVPGAAIVGTVSGVDPDLLPLVVLRAVGSHGQGSADASADRQGHYRLEDLAPGAWSVTASLQSTGEQATDEVALEPGAPEARLDLQFGRGLSLSGRALHGDTPVKGATVFAQGTDVNHSGWGRTDSDGKFAIKGLEPGRYRIDLRHWETGLSYSETVEIKESREIVLEIPTARMSGVVVDAADRQPLAGVTVALVPKARDAAQPSFLAERGATTDLTGRFQITDLEDGEWQLSASRKGYAARSSTVLVQNGHGTEDLRIELDPTEGLTLEVHLPSGRVPDEVTAVVLDPAGQPLTRGSFTTGENGTVRLSSVPPGSWEILLSAGGSGTASLEASVPGGPVPVSLPPACGLTVKVPDLAGSDLAATATIRGADGRPFRSLAWFSDPVSEWRLRRGEVELDTLPPGSWTVKVLAADGRTWQGAVATAPGMPASVVLN